FCVEEEPGARCAADDSTAGRTALRYEPLATRRPPAFFETSMGSVMRFSRCFGQVDVRDNLALRPLTPREALSPFFGLPSRPLPRPEEESAHSNRSQRDEREVCANEVEHADG